MGSFEWDRAAPGCQFSTCNIRSDFSTQRMLGHVVASMTVLALLGHICPESLLNSTASERHGRDGSDHFGIRNWQAKVLRGMPCLRQLPTRPLVARQSLAQGSLAASRMRLQQPVSPTRPFSKPLLSRFTLSCLDQAPCRMMLCLGKLFPFFRSHWPSALFLYLV